MIVQLSTRARMEFDAGLAFLIQRSQRAADDLAARMEAALSSLTELPHRGRPGAIKGTREIVVRRTPYVIVFKVQDELVLVLRIRHTSQDPTPDG